MLLLAELGVISGTERLKLVANSATDCSGAATFILVYFPLRLRSAVSSRVFRKRFENPAAGIDDMAAALEGGVGVEASSAGRARFYAGLGLSALAAGTLHVCILLPGSAGYAPVPQATWQVTPFPMCRSGCCTQLSAADGD